MKNGKQIIKKEKMTPFVIYNELDGKIKRYGSTSSGIQSVIVPEGFKILIGVGNYREHKVVDNKIVPKTIQEIKDDKPRTIPMIIYKLPSPTRSINHY